MVEVVSPDGEAPSRMLSVSASVNLPLYHKVHNFSSGTGSPGWSRKKGLKMVVVWCRGYVTWYTSHLSNPTRVGIPGNVITKQLPDMPC